MPWTVADVDGFKKGLDATQKKQWVAVANGSLAKCLSSGGKQSTCEASAIKQANGVTGNMEHLINYKVQIGGYDTRTEIHDNKVYIVVPVVMMLEGVHNGSMGPILHTAEELAKNVEIWNGIPVTIEHPKDEGGFISANSPDVVEQQGVGRVYNSRIEDGKLKGEAWIEEEKATKVSSETLNILRQHGPMEISVGVFTDDEKAKGKWRGESYISIARNYKPDHLALLPDEVGACSVKDGCGVRANIQVDDNGDLQEHTIDTTSGSYTVATTNNYTIEGDKGGDNVQEDLAKQVMDLKDKVDCVEKQVTSLEGDKGMPEEKKDLDVNKGDCADKVLAAMSEKEEKAKAEQEVADKDAAILKANEAVKTLTDSLSTYAGALEVLTGEAKAFMEYGKKLYDEERDKLVKRIIEANKDAFPEDELKGKSLEELNKLSSLISAQVINYSPQGAGSSGGSPRDRIEKLFPAGVGEVKQEAK